MTPRAFPVSVARKKLARAAAGLSVDFRKDDAVFREGLGALPGIAAAFQKAGATRMGTWLSPSHDELTYNQNFARHRERLREIAKILGDHGIRLGLEYVGTQLLLVGRRTPFSIPSPRPVSSSPRSARGMSGMFSTPGTGGRRATRWEISSR